ncbi:MULTISPECIES: hypothetical protein [Brevundimonas]|uniref:DUF4126 domain-containing protein n=1 Tax=Brevundimonas abyssalis TAR-001 TaxID=1391729 RepID=A0A8E0KJU3_9CAUL|nr:MULTISPECIES: hypothetical protein [Brevundimonas]GAD57939.1 hypothetical protein MBEBAB_0189 [Brevundimonas abyssalis TAR-001]
MILYLLAFLIGVVAGLRTMTAAAAVSWAAWTGALPLAGTPLAFLGATVTPWILTVMALGELVVDQLPKTSNRKIPIQFGARLLIGGVAGAAIGAAMDNMLTGAGLGLMGALIGTYCGAEARARLAAAFGRDRPAALIEDAVAVTGAVLIVAALP